MIPAIQQYVESYVSYRRQAVRTSSLYIYNKVQQKSYRRDVATLLPVAQGDELAVPLVPEIKFRGRNLERAARLILLDVSILN